MQPISIKHYIEQHGFEAFYNADDSISFYLPYTTGGKITGEVLITVRTFKEARIELGY